MPALVLVQAHGHFRVLFFERLVLLIEVQNGVDLKLLVEQRYVQILGQGFELRLGLLLSSTPHHPDSSLFLNLQQQVSHVDVNDNLLLNALNAPFSRVVGHCIESCGLFRTTRLRRK